MMHNSKNTERW